MYEILKAGGFTTGGINFDAKVRRGSFEPEDLFYAHIIGMDSYAKGLKVAARLIEDRVIDDIIEERYSSYKNGIGLDIVTGKANFHTLEEYALQNPIIKNTSGRQEIIRALINQYLFG